MSNWIKCSEQLPNEGQSVLVFVIDNSIYNYNHICIGYIEGDHWDLSCESLFSHNDISHWQPLPKPPGEGE